MKSRVLKLKRGIPFGLFFFFLYEGFHRNTKPKLIFFCYKQLAMNISWLLISQQLQPIRKSKLTFLAKISSSRRHVFLVNLKHVNGAKDRLFPNKTVLISNGAR